MGDVRLGEDAVNSRVAVPYLFWPKSSSRAYCANSRCGGWRLLQYFSLSCLSPSLWTAVRFKLKYYRKRPNTISKQNNQPSNYQSRCRSGKSILFQVIVMMVIGYDHYMEIFEPVSSWCSGRTKLVRAKFSLGGASVFSKELAPTGKGRRQNRNNNGLPWKYISFH